MKKSTPRKYKWAVVAPAVYIDDLRAKKMQVPHKYLAENYDIREEQETGAYWFLFTCENGAALMLTSLTYLCWKHHIPFHAKERFDLLPIFYDRAKKTIPQP